MNILFFCLGCASRPEVDAGPEANTENVLGAPVNQIEVEVVLQFRRIQNFERNLGNFPRRLARRAQKFLTFGRDGGERVGRAQLVDHARPFRPK